MVDIYDNAANPNTADEEDNPNLLSEAGNKGTLLGEAGNEDEQAKEAEETRLLETEDDDLAEEDVPKKAALVKSREEKRLLETDDKELSGVDKARKAELVKAKEVDAKANEVPEKYEFKVPEGMDLDQGLADKISPVLKEMKISQADAQKLTDIYAEHAKAIAEANNANFGQFLKDSYDETVKALGSNWREELKYVARVRDRFFTKETQELFETSGIGNQKPVILDLIKLGKMISEDKTVGGKKETPAGSKSAAEMLYPNSKF